MSSLALKEWRPYSPNVRVLVENAEFTVRTVTSWREWYAVLKFRKEVFLAEFGLGKTKPFSVDFDRFDWKCDQLVVIDKSSQEIVGCYRVLCSLFTDRFYSETEFDLSHIKRLPGTKVELGRACVHPDFRGGAVIQLLWRGIADYIKQTKADYAFGCTSFKTVDPVLARKIEFVLTERGALSQWPRVAPLADYDFTERELREQSRVLSVEEDETKKVAKQFPPLLKFYMRLGAKFHGTAAIDRKFGCLDFFTLFDFKRLSPQMKAKFGLD